MLAQGGKSLGFSEALSDRAILKFSKVLMIKVLGQGKLIIGVEHVSIV